MVHAGEPLIRRTGCRCVAGEIWPYSNEGHSRSSFSVVPRHMHRTVEAIVEADGQVRLLEPARVTVPCRALLTILDEPADESGALTAQLSEAALADWSRAEEDSAWSHLQPVL